MFLPSGIDAAFYDSRGNYSTTSTTSTASALQALMDALSQAGGGTIWVTREFTLDQPLSPKSNVKVDFQGHIVLLNGKTFAQFAGVTNATLTRVYLAPDEGDGQSTCTEGQTNPIVIMGATSTASELSDCVLRNILLKSGERSWLAGGQTTNPWHCYNGIEIPRKDGRSVRHNSIEDVFFFGSCNLLMINESASTSGISSEVEGNFVMNLAGFRCMSITTFVPAQVPTPRGVYSNTLINLRGQTDFYFTHAAVRGITGQGNHIDHAFIWDFWHVSTCCTQGTILADWTTTSSADWTYINSDAINGLLDAGTNSRVVVMGPLVKATTSSSQLQCSCSIQPPCTCTSCCGTSGYYTIETNFGTTAYCFCTSCGNATSTATSLTIQA